MSLTDWLKSYIPKWLAAPISLLILILIGIFLLPPNLGLPSQIVSTLTNLPTPKIMGTLILWFLAMSCFYAFLYRRYMNKPNVSDYEFINPPGCFKHKITGLYFCQPCLLKNDIPSQLTWVNAYGMQCKCCGEPYKIDLAKTSCIPSLEQLSRLPWSVSHHHLIGMF